MTLLLNLVNLRKMLFLLLLMATSSVSSQVLINANVRINGFRHNHDCGNDAGGFNSQPDPRYRVWMGYNAGNFSQITNAPGLYPGCANTYGADAVFCSTWNPGIINAITFNAQPLNQINVDLESWEEDGCGGDCTAGSCTFNSDDIRCGRTRVGDIDFWNQAPCQDFIYVGEFTSGSFLSMHNRCSDNNGRGYGIDRLIVNWDFASPPTILSDAFPFDRVLCPGESTTLTVSVNSWNGWSLGRLIQWQVSTNTDCNAPATWTDIPGANSLSYTPPQTPGTRLYRCIISSHCNNINLQQVISQCVRVTYHPYAAPIISNVCNGVAVPGVPVQFCTTQPPAPNASYANSSYQWSVSPAGGVTISNPTSACTDITFTTSGSVTISLTYGDACPEANATAICATTVSPPACDMIYVDGATGNNANIGLPGSPVSNLWRAFQLIGGGRNNIRITGGTYTEPNILNLQNDVFVDGRWQNNGGVWTKSSNQNTILNCSGEETIGTSVTHKVAFKASGVNNWRLQDLIINTSDNTGNAPDGRGKSNYGVLIDNCANYAVNRCEITVGRASNGGNGGNGGNGATGSQGAIGLQGHCDNNTTNRLGGAGATANGTGVRQGGAGGNGGRGSDYNSSNNTAGLNGSNGGNGANGGSGAGVQGSNGGCGTSTDRDGRKGNDGAVGNTGTNAPLTVDVTNTTFNNYWIPNGAAIAGTDGGGGGGGQGGGGGGRQSGTFCDDGGGSGGGGGGSGGQGGQGGEGGRGGGGAFAIYRFNSNTGALIQDVVLNIPGIITNGGAAGTGGTGGQGGAGGCGAGGNNTSTTSGGSLGNNGGLCSTNRVCNSTEVGAGGQGGRGGNGGNGGNGQPGANGINAHMITDGVITNPTTSIPNPTTITLDYPINAKGCNNSEVHLNNTNPSTWTLTGSTLLDDLNQSNSSYSYNSTPLVVYYPNAGTYDIGTNGDVYRDWINIIDGTRPAQANFNLASSTVCAGSTINLNASPWGTELAWEWVLFELTTLSPISTQTTQTATYTFPNVTTPTNYQIRYRVRESCCGWSKPYYTTITVVPVAEAVIASTSNIICPGETVTLSTSGGGTYLWSNNETTSSITVNTPGTYSVTVTDANGCTSTAQPVVLDLSPAFTPLVTAGATSIICPPAGVTLTASGGATYLWNNGETTTSITTTTAGVYDVLVTDVNGCDAGSAPFTVYEISANLVSDGSANICQGDDLTLTVASSYMDPNTTYVWTFNGNVIVGQTGNSISVNQTGAYAVTVSNGTCTQNSSAIQVTVFEPTISSTNNDNTLCPGSSLTLTASSGTTFQWQLNGVDIPGATNATYSATVGGTYTVVASDGNCSTTSGNFVITEIVPTVSGENGASEFCPGSSILLTSSLGSSYQWQLNGVNIVGATNQTYSATAPGNYTVVVTTTDGSCTSTSAVFVLTEILPIVTSSTGGNELCPGSSITLSSSAGLNYQWQLNGVNIAGATNQTLVVTEGGSYTVISTTLDGTCTSTSAAFVVSEIVPVITGAGGGSSICPGSSLLLTATAADSYQWQLNGVNIAGATSQTFDATQAGTYTVTTSITGCVSTSDNFVVTEISPTISSTNNANTFCPGSTFVLTASNGTSYQWQLNGVNIAGETNQTLTVTQSGSYTVVVTDGLCSATSSAFVVTAIIPTVTSSNGTNNLCPGETVTLTSSVGSSYQWQLNGNNIAGATNQTLSIAAGGTYTVVVTTTDGSCTSTSAAFVITETVPTVTSTNNATTLCPGQSLVLTSSTADSYQWQSNGTNIAGATNQTLTVSAPGDYTVTTVNGSCTSTSVIFTVTNLNATVTSVNGSNVICPGDQVVLTVGSGANYQWFLNGNPIAGATSQTYTATQSGSYSVSVNNGNCQLTSNNFTLNTNPNGCGSDTTIYDFTGDDQTFVVPADVTCLDLRMWAGGGGSADNSNGGYGGGAAYVGGRLSVTPGQVLTIRVGGGGVAGTTGNNTANGTSVYPNGGIGRRQARGGGNGGGFSAVFLANTPLAIAGAGGGGAGSGLTSGNGTNYCGGVGAEVGQNGTRGGERNGCAQGAGGCGGNANGTNNNCLNNISTNANGYQGGNGENGNFTYGGAGGGGGYAGGQGGLSGDNNSGGAGGGSSFFSGTQLSSFSGNTTTAGNATDFFNQGLYGGGGLRSSTTAGNTGNAGQNGRIVLIVANQVTPTFSNLPSTICSQSTTPSLPDVSNEGIAGTWSPSTLSSSQSGSYTFTPNPGSCATSFSFNTNVINCDTVIYDYTGDDQTFVVPAGVTCIDVLLWGAGGGSGDNSDGGNGGGGAFVRGRLGVTPGQTLTVVVGGGGRRGIVDANGNFLMPVIYGGGGRGRSENRGGGGGGGRSAIRLATTEWATAAGGGGGAGSGSNSGNGTRYCGGAGAALNGTGTRGGDRDGCATGAGGCGGTPTAGQNCTGGVNGAQFLGGDGENIGNQTYGGAGGGGGYFGGEGGATGGNNSGGGGGGSSFILNTAISVASNAGTSGGTGGNTTVAAGNWTDFFNQNLYGGGGGRGTTQTANSGNNGQNGRVVFIVSPPTTPTFNNIPTTLCQNATAPTLPTTSIEGIVGIWSPATVNTTQTTTYTFTPNPNYCANTTQITITVPQATITSANGQNVICTGQTLVLTASAGTSYQWQNNGTNIFGATNQTYTVNQAGSYTVTVNDGTCTSTSQAFIVTQFSPEVTTNNDIATICPGTSLTLNATAGQSYQWSFNGQAINGATNQSYTASQAGVYTVAINNGVCTSTTLPFTISVFNPVVTSTNGVTSVCPGASVTLTATQGASYQWFLDGNPIAGATNQTFDATQAGTYSVSVNNGNCAVTSGNFVLSTFNPTVSSTSGSNLLCPGGNIVLNATAGTSYQWQLNGVNLPGETNSNLIANQAGNYTVVVNNGVCSSTSSVFTVSFYTPVITGAGGSNQICQGGTLVLNASNGVSYQWQLNGTDIPGATNATYTATQAGTYNVIVNNGSCSASSANFVLTEIINPTPSIDVTAAGGCAPTTGTISSSGTFTSITWFVNNTQVSTDPSFNFTFSQPGCYTVTAVGTLNNGCSVNVTDAQAICLTPSPNAFFTVYPSFFSQEIQNITFNNASTDAVSYAWDFGDGSVSNDFNAQHTFANTQAGYTVSLTVTSENGCTDIHYVTIPYRETGAVYYVPNTFTPDGDAFNQTFKPVFTSGFDPYDFEMTIFNRWGETVFVSKDSRYGWDGSYGQRGFDAPDGVYTWKISFKSQEVDKRVTLVGHVNLIR